MTTRDTIQKMLGRIRRHAMYFLNVRVDNIDIETALETVHAATAGRDVNGPKNVFFTNVHTIHLARHNPQFRQCVNEADMVLPDGIGLKIAARVFGTHIVENLNGTDFAPKLFRYAEAMGRTVYLLGAHPDVIKPCRDRLEERYPNLRIVGYHHGYFSREEEEAIVSDINAKRPDILLVAFGSPQQEEWIAAHRRDINTRMCFAVGGLFDFIAGRIRRAPEWMRRVGCEWVYRFFQDPGTKWTRVFVEIPLFLTLMLVNRFSSNNQLKFVSRRVALR